MKLRSLYIHQFGKLKERELSFGERFTLISGGNESGKSTMHTAIRALLFGLERGRGRAARTDTWSACQPWSEPELYGGELEWEQDGRTLRVERDFARIPPLSRATLEDGGHSRPIPADALPLPEGLTPYLFVNTLSFRQVGAATGEGLEAELRNHVLNLGCSGDEDLNVQNALLQLKNRRRALDRELDRDAETQQEQLRRTLEALEQEDLSRGNGDWEGLKALTERTDRELEALSEKRDRLNRAVQQKTASLERLGLNDMGRISRNRERADKLARELEKYRSSYGEEKTSRPRLLSLLTFLLVLLIFFIFFLVSRLIVREHYLLAVPCFLAAVLAATCFTRLTRRTDSAVGDQQNRLILSRLLKQYLPEYESRGVPKEAEQLRDFLTRVLQLDAQRQTEARALQQCTEELLTLSKRRRDMDLKLEQELRIKLSRERWENQVRELRSRLEALQPRLEKNALLRQEIAALDLAVSTLSRLSEEVLDSFGTPLSREASAIFTDITGGVYQGVEISDSLELMALQHHRRLPPSALSVGTLEQLYFSFRLAVIRLLWPDEPMPLFFDDSFAMYDSDRLEALLAWLELHYRGQIVIFSCQEREKELLQRLNIPFEECPLER